MAVQWIGSLSDAELLDYLPQLVQVRALAFPSSENAGLAVRCATQLPCSSPGQALKYECYLDSPLVRFLLRRAIADLRVTHYFFW